MTNVLPVLKFSTRVDSLIKENH